MRTMILVAAAVLLGACAQGPERVDRTNPTVTYSFDGEKQLDKARVKAEKYCKGYGRKSRLTDVVNQSGPDLAVFDCI